MTAVAGASFGTADEMMRRAPRAWAKVTAAEDHLLSRRWHFGCRHVLSGSVGVGSFVTVCTDHLSAGLFCEPASVSIIYRATARSRSTPATNAGDRATGFGRLRASR